MSHTAACRRDAASDERDVRAVADRARDMMVTFDQQLAEASRRSFAARASAGDARAVADAFWVAADLAEERGFGAWARDLRGNARRAQVVAWAARVLPDARIGHRNVITLVRGSFGSSLRDEFRDFLIPRPLRGSPNAETEVSVDRRGRVRIVRDLPGGRRR